MSLRSGTTYWQSIGPPPLEAPPLAADAKCEIAILGGGVTGALLAYRLTKLGIDTTLIDKRPLGTGSTAASTGLLQYEVDTPLVELIGQVGVDHAVHAYRRGLEAIDEIERLVDELGTPCGFERKTTLYFASHASHVEELRREFDCRLQHGFDVSWLSGAQLPASPVLPAGAAVRSAGDGQIDPYCFTQKLLSAATAAGLRCWSRTEVTSIDETGDCVQLHTPRGTIRARRIVYATGYDSYRYLPADPGKLHCTYAAVSEPLGPMSDWPDGALLWETARPYFYARQTADGRAVIGGEDTEHASDHQRDALVEHKTELLAQRFGRLFPQLEFRPEFAWAGTFGESPDGLAFIGQPAGRPKAYFAIGYGGNGITFSVIASRLIADLYRGVPNPDAAVFAFDRVDNS